MASELKLNLDPKQILQAMDNVSEATKKLASVVEESLGKEAVKSIEGMDKSAEKGANSIASRFKDLGKRIKEDLKTAFNITELMGGLKLAESLGQGIKEVFGLERAFDKLNTRLQLSGKNFQDFKKTVGTAVASTGQKLEDVFPGLETAAAKGNVRSPSDLAAIAKGLGQVRAATGENTESLADSVVEILKSQNKKVTAETFQQTLDALQGTRTAGSFKTAGDAGHAIQAITTGITPEQLKRMGVSTRDLGGLAAQASKAGEGGPEILQHILKMATQAGGKELINSIFGTQLFKGDKLDVAAFTKVNKQQYGKYSEQVLASATGADQAQLSRFLDVMKSGMGDFKKVASGSNETATQFKLATNNLASSVDQFKERTKNATRQIGDDLAASAQEFLKGNRKGALEDLKHAGKSAMENKGVLGTALAGTAAGALLLGGGAKGLLSKVPGMGGAVGSVLKGGGGLAKGIVGGELAKATGATPVYVVNASEIGGSGIGGAAGAVGGTAGASGILAKFGILGAALAGGFAGKELAESKTGEEISDKTGLNTGIDKLLELTGLSGVNSAQKDLEEAQTKSKERQGIPASKEGKESHMKPEEMKKAIIEGFVEGHQRVNKNKPVNLSNPSRPSGSGGNV